MTKKSQVTPIEKLSNWALSISRSPYPPSRGDDDVPVCLGSLYVEFGIRASQVLESTNVSEQNEIPNVYTKPEKKPSIE